jgi:hypothetical protein
MQGRTSLIAAGAALFIALGGSAVAANKVRTKDLANNAVTGAKIKNGAVAGNDLSPGLRQTLRGTAGISGATGEAGASGAPGASGTNGTNGTNGPNGANGANGPNGANGVDGDDGAAGTNGTDGEDGADGADGLLAPLSAVVPSMAIPTSASRTVIATLAVAAGDYVVLAKTQLSHTGAGDSVDCYLKAGSAEIDQVSMKTHPALAATPAALQAVTTTSPTQLSLECKVLTANGSADHTKLIAIPIG